MSLDEQMKAAIEKAIPQSTATVVALGGGHYEIDVVTPSFEGRNRLQRQRWVYEAIGSFMAGENAAVHAVDRLHTRTPDV